MQKAILSAFVMVVVSFLAFQVVLKPLLDNDVIYQPIDVAESKLASQPIYVLFNHLKKGKYQLIGQQFTDPFLVDQFLQSFHIDSTNFPSKFSAYFSQRYLTYKVEQAQPLQKKNTKGDYLITISIDNNDSDGKSGFVFRTSFDSLSHSYLISQIDHFTAPTIVKTENARVQVPPISVSPCVNVDQNSPFTYIRLEYRDANRREYPIKQLGSIPEQTSEHIPEDFYQTDAIRQIPFSIIKQGDYTYDPGNVISVKDAEANQLRGLFRNIWDGVGTLTLTDVHGKVRTYPTAFFIDNYVRRLSVLSLQNDYIVYGHRDDHYHFSAPQAVCIIGNFIYVLDQGDSDKIVVLRANLSDKLTLEKVGETDFGVDLRGASDITGFAAADNNVLYIASLRNATITQVLLDPSTGLIKPNALPKEFSTYLTSTGERVPIGYINRLGSNPISSDGKNTLFAIQWDTHTWAFYVDGLADEAELHLNYEYEFPNGSGLANVGYNLGDNSFNVTDNFKGKVHFFSAQGAYLGAGGTFGKSEKNEEFFYPSLISSNTFANDAIEMLVTSRWDDETGFKRTLPKADLGKIEVIEKAPRNAEDLPNHSLLFRYALTSGYQVEEVKLKLNGHLLKQVTESLYPDIHSEEFLVNAAGEHGLADKLRTGWNTFEVELNSRIAGPSHATLQNKRTKKIDFYFTPSVLSAQLIGGKEGVFHSKANPLILYKNTFIQDEQVTLEGGKVILMPGCTLSIAKQTNFTAKDEDFEFYCGALLEVNVQKEIPKLFESCYFNGLLKNYGMISCRGEYTGGEGSGSAPSSQLEFIGCRMDNYIGKALHIREGRATVVNTSFTSTLQNQSNPFLTAAAIVVAPEARLDVRGGMFINNHIAIDANSAELYIGQASQSYKGNALSNPVFKNNQIAIHAYESFSDIEQTTFEGNKAAIIQLSGELDISKNSQNIFKDNVQAIIFSDVAKGFQGNNQFINNNVDLSFISPPDGAASVHYDFTCNYWLHGEVSGVPVIDQLGTNSDEIVTIETIPFLNKKGSQFTCTGGKSNPGGARYQVREPRQEVEDSTFQHPYHQTLSQLQDKLHTNASEAYREILQMSNAEVILKKYRDSKDTSALYHEAIVKNSILDYLYRSEDAPEDPETYIKAYAFLGQSASYSEHYVDITEDKIAFLNHFMKQPRKVIPRYEEDQPLVPHPYLLVYPNPFSQEATIELSLPSDGTYSIKIFNSTGKFIKTSVKDQTFLHGYYTFPIHLTHQPAGLYLVNLYGQHGQLLDTYRVIKK